jgi:hypothetical protein
VTGHEYRKLIARYLLSAYDDRGLEVFEEVGLGTSIIGKQRRLDLFLREPSTNRVMGLECKYQDSSGTVDEKIPYALQDLAALRVPAALCYAGGGFSHGVLHLLQSSEVAAYCLPDDSLERLSRSKGDGIDCGTWQLDHLLAAHFGWWDVVLAGKRPTVL